MDGLDTEFFFDLWTGTDASQTMWRSLTQYDQSAAVSSVTLFEITRHGLNGHVGPAFAETIVQRSGIAYEQAPVDPTDVLNRGARIAHGMGLPRADALIAASLEAVGCDRLVTADTDFEAYAGEMEVVFL